MRFLRMLFYRFPFAKSGYLGYYNNNHIMK